MEYEEAQIVQHDGRAIQPQFGRLTSAAPM